MTSDLALREVELVTQLGVDLRLRTRVGEAPTWPELFAEYDAVFLGVGLPRAVPLGIPGEELPGVRQALDFIEELKLNPPRAKRVGKRVAVIGGGNTAVDAATQAKRLGAERVTMIYRRGRAEMSAFDYEIELLRADGCELLLETVPVRLSGKKHVERLVCQRVAPGKPGKDGKRTLRKVPGTVFTLDVDLVIAAIGQRLEEGALGKIPGLSFEGGAIAVDRATFRTGHPKVWAAGDCANGGAEVVNAVAEGRDAARSLHGTLAGKA